MDRLTIENIPRNYENCWVPNNFYSPSVAPTLGSQFSKKRSRKRSRKRSKKRSKKVSKRKRKFSKRKSRRKSMKSRKSKKKFKRRFSSQNLNKKNKQNVNNKLREIKKILKGRCPPKTMRERSKRIEKADMIKGEIIDIFIKEGYKGGRTDRDFNYLMSRHVKFGSSQTKSPLQPGFTDISGILLGPSAFQWENNPLDRALNA
jgi:hypothetical protein